VQFGVEQVDYWPEKNPHNMGLKKDSLSQGQTSTAWSEAVSMRNAEPLSE
jgi:hypothetical protein